jgi:hypothetical protein
VNCGSCAVGLTRMREKRECWACVAYITGGDCASLCQVRVYNILRTISPYSHHSSQDSYYFHINPSKDQDKREEIHF